MKSIAQSVNSLTVRLSAMCTAVCVMAYYSSMPVILGRAAVARNLSENDLGLLAGAFAGGVAITAIAAIFFIRHLSWKKTVVVGGLLAALAFSVPIFTESFQLTLVTHLIAGLACGLGYSVAIACLGDSDDPTRNYAFCFVLQTIVGMTISHFLPRLTTADNGFQAALLLLASLSLFSVFFSIVLPTNNLKQNAQLAQSPRLGPSVYLMLSLAVIFLIYAGDGSVWAFVEMIALKKEFTPESAGTAVGLSLLAGAFGSFMAGTLGTKYGYFKPMLVSVVVSIASVIMLELNHSITSFMIAIAINGWAWNFGSGYRMGLVAELDTSGRFTPLITGMQLLGTTAGTIIAGFLVTDSGFQWVYIFAAIAWTVSLLLFSAALRSTKKTEKSDDLLLVRQ